MSFMAAEPKRKADEMSGESSSSAAAVPAKKPKNISEVVEMFLEDKALRDIRKDWNIVKMARKKDQLYEPFLHHKEFVKKIVGMKGNILKYLPDEMRDDPDVVKHAVLGLEEEDGLPMHPSAIQWASDRLKNNVPFIKEICVFLDGWDEHGPSRKKTIFSYLPIDIVKQVEPVTPYLLEKSVRDVDFGLFQSQRSILPKNRVRLLKILFSMKTWPVSKTQMFNALVDGPDGEYTLRRNLPDIVGTTGYQNKKDFEEQFCNFMVHKNVDLESFKRTMSRVRGIGTLTLSISTAAASYSSGPIDIQNGIVALLAEKLIYISYRNVDIMFSLLQNFMKKLRRFSAARRLNFSSSSPDLRSDPDAVVTMLLENIPGIRPNSYSGFNNASLDTIADLLLVTVQKGYAGATNYLLRTSSDLLLSHNVNKLHQVEGKNTTLLSIAVYHANLEMVQILLSYGADVNDNRLFKQRTALMLAPNVDIVKALFDYARFDSSTATERARPAVNQSDSKDCTALYYATAHNRTEVVRELLRRGASPNFANVNNRTPLFKAVTNLSVEIVRMLLNPRLRVDVNFEDIHGETVLHKLATLRMDTTTVLVQDSQDTTAVKTIFQLLVANGAALSVADPAGKTPLAMTKNKYMRKLLIDAGAGGKIRIEKFRRIDSDIFTDSPVVLKTKKDDINLEDHIQAPVRCLGISPLFCRHVFSGPYIHHWFNTTYGGEYKNQCPICRQEIKDVEIFSTAKAEEWDSLEKEALNEEKKMEARIKELSEGPRYRQLVAQVEQAKQRLKEAEQQLSPLDQEMRDIRAASDAKQSELRGKQIVKQLQSLKF